jgi:hypothetical protein
MKLNRSMTPWLVASLIFGGLTLFLANASGDDPISAGLIEMGCWASAFATAISVVGLCVTALR